MNTPAHTQHDRDLALLAAGGETGWSDQDGRPAPWPDDFFDPDTPWRPSTSNTPTELVDAKQPF